MIDAPVQPIPLGNRWRNSGASNLQLPLACRDPSSEPRHGESPNHVIRMIGRPNSSRHVWRVFVALTGNTIMRQTRPSAVARFHVRMTTDPRCPTTEAVNSRLLILPFCMDAIVHKHAATLRQLPRNIFDVGQSGSLGHYRPPSRILRKASCLAPTIITPIASTRFRNASMSAKVSYQDKT